MKTQLCLPTPRSELIAVLLQIITNEQSTSGIIIQAAELIVLDIQFDCWFLEHVKPRADEETVERLLALSDEVTDRVRAALAEFERGADSGVERLRRELVEAARTLRSEMI